jgi:hypothetical protein
VAELYTPSTVGGLLSGLESLGWDQDRFGGDDDILKWMNNVRLGKEAGWRSLGHVAPSGSGHSLANHKAQLPADVVGAMPVLISITASVTALVTCFMVPESSSEALNAALRADYSTTLVNDPGFRWRQVFSHVLWGREGRFGHQLFGPDDLRAREAQRLAGKMEGDCVAWVSRHLPGVFTTSLNSEVPPTALLYLTEKSEPLTEEARSIRALNGLGLTRSWDSWHGDDWAGARMALPESWRGSGQRRMVFGCRRKDAFPPQSGYHDPESNWTIAQRANDLVPALLVRWSLSCLLDGFHQVLSGHRDETANRSGFRPIKDLDGLRSLVQTQLYDVALSAQEIDRYAESEFRYCYDVLDMSHILSTTDRPIVLLAQFRSNQRARSEQLKDEQLLLQTTLATTSDLTQTISSIRTQRWIVILAAVSIAIALVALLR